MWEWMGCVAGVVRWCVGMVCGWVVAVMCACGGGMTSYVRSCVCVYVYVSECVLCVCA